MKGFTAVIFGICMTWLLLPIILPLTISFTELPTVSFPPKGFTLKWFVSAINNEFFVNGFKLSLTVATIASIASLALSFPIVYYSIKGLLPMSRFFFRAYEIPIIIPQMVLGFGLFIFIVRYLQITSLAGLILGHAFIVSPYTMRNLYSGLSWINFEMEDAAQTLGASKTRAFFEILLPNAKNALLIALISSFLISFNAVEISLFLSVKETVTLPVAMLNYLVIKWDPSISALSTLLVLFTILLVFVSEFALGGRK